MSFEFVCVFVLNLGLINGFNLWDYCSESEIDCELKEPIFSYGSAYDSLNLKWYLLGGSYDLFKSTKDVEVISLPATPSFTGFSCSIYSQELPDNFCQNEGAIFNNILHSIGGFSDDFIYKDDVYTSNVVTESPFVNSQANIPIPISGGCSLVVSNKIYIIGGLTTGDTIIDTLYEYDSESTVWRALSPMNFRRFAPGCTYHNGNIYVFAGATNGFADTNSIEIYNIESDTWIMSNSTMSYSARWLTAAYLDIPNVDNDIILVLGGSQQALNFDADNVIDVYDIGTDTILQTTNMTKKRYAFKAITPYNGNYILYAGGKDAARGYTDINAIYCPPTNYNNTSKRNH